MKRVLFSVVLLLAASFAFAQTKAVKEAKSAANAARPDFAKAESLINGALENAETKDDPETWNIAGFIQKRRSEKEMENAYLRKPYDTLQVYNSALEMAKYYIKCDELAQIPDAKGKVKNKYRKANSAAIMADRGNLLNGGIQFINNASSKEGEAANADNRKALEFFGMYIDLVNQPIMQEQQAILKADTLVSQIAYYAALAAYRLQDNDAILKYALYAEDDKEYGANAMEFISIALKNQNKTDEWVASLQRGVEKYPNHAYFFANLIDYYSNNNKYDEALVFAQNMLKKDPNNAFFLYVMGYLYQSTKVYDKAIEFYKNTIAADPNYAEAHSNLGLVYCQQAQEISDRGTTDVNDPKYNEEQAALKVYYEKAKPHYEEARKLKPDNRDLWLQGLYRVYYNLNMGPQFQEIENLMM